ncbi:hypothetical protein MUN88_00945 [Gracilibacillus caseinilyticus]|uniref:Yip1 domain-containing protein n=1 Tax=Gracilibacillus caseinilyticus TaxID=2932256 RepID=A0ABY4EWI1_9BACI|nr:hypothetical protein [Gracilibacillus caseinilyticus]UOQ48759.1 hypothetical protein MUN88_00945 [Gracilibacillus caseinilyticus]
MSGKSELSDLLSRKVIAATISGSLFAIMLGLADPNPFSKIRSVGQYFQDAAIAVPAYLMYSFPVILVYATITSVISDYIAYWLAAHTRENLKIYFLLTFHVLFGLILLWYSLFASILYFITDYVLMKKDIYKWNHAVKSFWIPILVWVFFIGTTYVIGWFE